MAQVINLMFPERLLDSFVFPRLSEYRSYASAGSDIYIDMSKVEWADALSLLMLGVTLRSHLANGSRISFHLGDLSRSTIEHRVFIKFMADQGFLEAFAEFSTVSLNIGKQIWTDVERIKEEIISIPQPTNLPGVDCIHAKIIGNESGENSESFVEKLVDSLLRECRVRVRDAAFGSSPLARDRVFQKLRKLLYELTLNVFEHAYEKGVSGQAGIYVRVRGRRPALAKDAAKWDAIWAEERKNGLAISQLELDVNSDWLEVFVCDAGCGLLHRLDKWLQPNLSLEAKNAIDGALRATEKLFSIGPSLFKLPLSRFGRTNDRPAVTGLQFLGHMLSLDGDYCRIHTSDRWLGGRHPWADAVMGSTAKTESLSKVSAPGTAFAIVLQPREQKTVYEQDTWHTPDELDRWRILDALKDNVALSGDIRIVDRREEGETQMPPSNLHEVAKAPIVIFRPRRHLPKNIASKWIEAVAGRVGRRPEWRTKALVIAELTPSQAVIMAEAVRRFHTFERSRAEIYLVSEEWAVTCLTSGDDHRLKVDLGKAKSFLAPAENHRGPTAAQLAVALRDIDTSRFWTAHDVNQQCFVHGKVEWKDGIMLDGFLDLAVSLTDPLKYRACRRALRRILQLLPEFSPQATDDIVATLLGDAYSGSYGQQQSQRLLKKYPVGSICVTQTTIAQYLKRFGQPATGVSVTLFTHESARLPRDCNPPIQALGWRRPKKNKTEPVGSFVRIPDTPFITERSAPPTSIVRFKSNQSTQPFSEPFYPRSPTQTYEDFLRYQALKLGHWNYQGRHDLLTINFSQIVDLSILENGPLLGWLLVELERLFTSHEGLDLPAALLVYPSHKVTDQLVQYFRTNEEFSELLKRVAVIPISFVGSHSVSPLTISPLTQMRIRDAIVRSGRKRPAAVIFDDAAVTGKHLREVAQLLQETGVGVVHTLTLLDRTGLPIREGVMEGFLKRHKRYWRWDVPTIGHSRDCIVCAALRRIVAMKAQPLPPHLMRRLDEWTYEWSVTDIAEGWHSAGLSPANLHENVNLTFGLYHNGKKPARNEVAHKTSTSLAAMIAELTRLTTKADTALSKVRKMLAVRTAIKEVRDGNIQAAIEIIASQLIIFFDELSYWQKLERYWLLLEIVWTCSPETKVTGLVGICFSQIPDEIAIELWDRLKEALIEEKTLQNHDAVLCVKFVALQSKAAISLEELPSSFRSLIGRQNYALIANAGHYIDWIVALFSALGFRSGQSHEIPLLDCLKLIAIAADKPRVEMLAAHKKAIEILELLFGALQRLSRTWVVAGQSLEGPSISEDMNTTNALISKGKMPECSVPGDSQKAWAKGAQLWLFGTGLYDGISKRYHKHFFQRLEKDAPQSLMLSSIIRSVRDSWDDINRDKRHNVSAINWSLPNGSFLKPKISYWSPTAQWESDHEIFFDSVFKQAVRDLLANVFHASGMMRNPWNYEDESTAHLWWKAAIEDGYLLLSMANSTQNAKVLLKPSVPIDSLGRVGGDLQLFCDPAKHHITATVRIPLATTLVRDL